MNGRAGIFVEGQFRDRPVCGVNSEDQSAADVRLLKCVGLACEFDGEETGVVVSE